MLYNELPTAFPWYDNLQKQARFKEHTAEKLQDFGLIAPRNALLPFQFYKKSTTGITPLDWKIYDINQNLVATMDAGSLGLLRSVVRENRRYFYYAGENLSNGGIPLNLAPGFYYSGISFTTGVFYSEVFQVPACSFVSTDATTCEFLKLEWYNDSDIRPIFYNDKDLNGVPYFRNVCYLDTFVHASEPEITEDGEKDGDDNVVPTFQKAVIRYRITELVPDFLKTALVISQMHDHVILTTRKGIRTGELEKITTASALEFNGVFSTVDILFEQDVAMVKKGCADNMSA